MRVNRRQIRRIIESVILEQETGPIDYPRILGSLLELVDRFGVYVPGASNEFLLNEADDLIAPYASDEVVLNELGVLFMKDKTKYDKTDVTRSLRYNDYRGLGDLLEDTVGIEYLKSGKVPALLALYNANK